jgi:putative ABC transport system ATP-binding protein
MNDWVIRVEDLSREYRLGNTNIPVLSGVSLSVHQGEFVALMGASGSGKSTLLSLLGLLDRPTSGKYWLEDVEVSHLRRDELAGLRGKRIGFIFQSFNLLARLSAWENVTLPLMYRKGEFSAQQKQNMAMDALVQVGLENRANHHPMELSGGERQRVAIARALITQPAVILADEPTGNLDSNSGRDIMRLLCDLHDRKRTIVMVTHDQAVAHYTDRILTMQDGCLHEGESDVTV